MYSVYKYMYWGRSLKYLGMEWATKNIQSPLAYRVNLKLHDMAYNCPTTASYFRLSPFISTSSVLQNCEPITNLWFTEGRAWGGVWWEIVNCLSKLSLS